MIFKWKASQLPTVVRVKYKIPGSVNEIMAPRRSGSDCRLWSQTGLEFQLGHMADGQGTEQLASHFPHPQNVSDNNLHPAQVVRFSGTSHKMSSAQCWAWG